MKPSRISCRDSIRRFALLPAIPSRFQPDQVRLQSLEAVLLPLKQFTKWVQEEAITMPHLPHRIRALLKAYEPKEELAHLATMRQQVHVVVEDRLGWILKENNLALQAAALHPAYGKLDFLDPELRQEVPRMGQSSTLTQVQVRKSLFAELDTVTCSNTNAKKAEKEQKQRRGALEDLLDLFDAGVIPDKTDPIQFWSDIENQRGDWATTSYRLTAPLARMYFTIPASSASAERAFSNSGFLQEGRERLTSKHLEQLAVCRDFVRKKDFSFESLVEALSEVCNDTPVPAPAPPAPAPPK